MVAPAPADADHQLVKTAIVSEMIGRVKPRRVIDLGANDGTFSRLATQAELVISADVDPAAVEKNYLTVTRKNELNILPLRLDIINPSPALGWANRERPSFTERASGDLVLALALVHHLAIGHNLPLGHISKFLAELSPYLIIEFVPKSDSQVQRLLAAREDIFTDYSQAGFESAFSTVWEITKRQPVKESDRIIYLMKRRHGQN